MRRILGVTAAVIALAVALSGCTLVSDGGLVLNDLRRGVAAQERLDTLAESLRKRDDVVTVEAGADAVYQTASVTVKMREDAAPGAIAEVATLVDEAMRGVELQPMKREFDMKAGGVSIRQSDFTQGPIDYGIELEYWGLAESAIGANLVLVLETDADGRFSRVFVSGDSATVSALSSNYKEFVALAPPNATDTAWVLPGLNGAVASPDHRILRFLANMASVTNLNHDGTLAEYIPGTAPITAPPAVIVFVGDRKRNTGPMFVLYTSDGVLIPNRADVWPLALATAKEALATGIANVRLQISLDWGDGADYAQAHIGECTELIPPSPADRKLVAELIASGVGITDDAAGMCLAFANP